MKLKELDSTYDIVVVGGGVTGAGVFSLSTKMGLHALLVEANDFAWGTSSRSSKMVHGGLRYLKEGKFLLTRAAVKERERLLETYPGLITPLNFIMPIYKNFGPSMAAMKTGLSIYSFMAGKKQHQVFDRSSTIRMIPGIKDKHLLSSVGFRDAQVDDARLVLRLIFDACDMGGHAVNYTRAEGVERDSKGRVCAVCLQDAETGESTEIRTKAVINATGPFAEKLHPSPEKGFHIRPLRGSHLIFPEQEQPLDRVISFMHPEDRRPVFLFPWEGTLVLGTTDVDHSEDLNREPGITRSEAEYLIQGLKSILPETSLSLDRAIVSIAGVRPVLSAGKKSASKESREHVVWKDKGLVTVTGGKLTTFRLLAKDALKAAAPYLPGKTKKPAKKNDQRLSINLDESAGLRLNGRYGSRLAHMTDLIDKNPEAVATTQTLWAELVHAAGSEQVRHLSDLLLRRVRIGLQVSGGGLEQMDQIRKQISGTIGWNDDRWKKEIDDYRKLWQRAYAPRPWRKI